MIKSDDFVVGGMQPLTMIDFPGHLATVVFAQGCNLRCRFCHNTTLLADKPVEQIRWQNIISFLKDRQGFIEGVVFSGGEPCRQSALLAAMTEVRELGFEIALHTNGFYPEILEEAVAKRLIKFVAVDFKAPLPDYQAIAGCAADEKSFARVAEILVESGVPHEYRTTVHPQLLKEADLIKMADWLSDKKISNYILQQFRFGDAFDKTLPPVKGHWLSASAIMKLRSRFTSFSIRSDSPIEELPARAA